MIPLLNFIFLFLLPLGSTSSIIHKPDCPDRCGNVSIPYPFGVGSDCSLIPSFNITCNTSSTPHKPYLKINDDTIEVVEIKPDNPPHIRIKYPYLLSVACYNISTENDRWQDWNIIDLSETQYTISEDNWLTAIGCDDFVAATTIVGNKSFRDACIGFCSNSTSIDGGTCPSNADGNSVGEGCCRSPIPKGTSILGANLVDMSKSWNRSRVFPCSYAFVKEKGLSTQVGYEYNYSMLQRNFTAFLQESTNLPVVRLDWRIAAQNCSEAPQNSSYACQENSNCVDFGADIGGYLCNCSEGYEGNPYLYPGCQDIDECFHHPCDPHSDCHNTPGSYNCKCRRGYTGDGKSTGSGCTPHFNMIKIVVIGVGCGLGFLLLVSICVLLRKVLQKRRNKLRKEKFFKQNGGFLLQQQTNEGTMGRTHLFLAEELEKATDNFSKCRVLGQGGQGIVYRGMLSNGKIVAVKKSKLVDKEQLSQFINEIAILSQINHRNVVKLLGCCLETEVPLLVYEYMPNGTLSNFIHDPKTEFPISWNMRLKIAADIAGALAYMHSASATSIYHRDIKSSNILLDEKYVVKVSDFGISRSVAVDQTHLTTRVKGTFGYFDPEYFQSNQFTEKSDVYSFGVVLVELITGKKPISSERDEEEKSLVTRFLTSIEENNVDGMLDPQVLEHGGKDEVSAVVLLARRCLNLQGRLRPTMKEVATELESLRFSQGPTRVKHESENTSVHEAKSTITSDLEYTWTASDISEIPSSSDIHPLYSEIV